MRLNPNCSESVFRLTGNLEEIKDEVLNMLTIIREDYKDGLNMKNKQDRDWWENHKKRVAYQREEIKKIENLKEFRMVVFPFTCNYETFFKPDKNNDLMVATCNNTDWTGLNMIEGNEEDYHKIAGYEHYDFLCSGEGWIYVSNKEKKVSPIIFKMEHERLDVDDDKSIKIIKKGKQFFYVGERIIRLEMIDKKKLTEEDKRILAECDKELVVRRLK